MKLELQTKTEKQNLLGLLIIGNSTAGILMLMFLLLQALTFPAYHGITWVSVFVLSVGVTYFNLKYFRKQFKLSELWNWLKQHQ